MKFQFAKYTEITDFAFEVNPDYKKESYIRFFICPDTHDYWFVRIMEGYNIDFQKMDGMYLLERNNISKERGEQLTVEKLREIIEEDDGSNWDMQDSDSLDDLIDMIDDGFGILNLQSNQLQA